MSLQPRIGMLRVEQRCAPKRSSAIHMTTTRDVVDDIRRGIVTGIKALVTAAFVGAGTMLITGIESSDEPAIRPQDQRVSAPIEKDMRKYR